MNIATRETCTLSWYNGTGSAITGGSLIQLNAVTRQCAIAYQDIAAGATGTIIVPKCVAVNLTLVSGDAAAVGSPIYQSSTDQKVTITGSSVAYLVGFSGTSVSSTSADQTIEVLLDTARSIVSKP